MALLREAVPMCQLGGAVRLGWTSWMLDKPATTDADDFCLDPEQWLRRRGNKVRGRANPRKHAADTPITGQAANTS